MFLTPRAVCLVVCDAGAFGEWGGGADDKLDEDIRNLEDLRVCDWLRSISQRVPRNDVILVATKCDLASGSASRIARGWTQPVGGGLRTGFNLVWSDLVWSPPG